MKKTQIAGITVLLLTIALIIPETAYACAGDGKPSVIAQYSLGFFFSFFLLLNVWTKKTFWKDSKSEMQKNILLVQAIAGCMFLASSIYTFFIVDLLLIIIVFGLFSFANLTFAILRGVEGFKRKKIINTTILILMYLTIALISLFASLLDAMTETLC